MKILQTMFFIKYLLFVYFTTITFCARSQTKSSLIDKINHYNHNFSKEKLYLIFDRENYNAGDTIWFKSVLLNGNNIKNDRSDKIHVELFNDSNKLMDNRVIMLNNGLGYGDIALETRLPDGNYSIRAYTNWQQNFGTSYFFQKDFSIGNNITNSWLINAYQKVKIDGSKGILDLKVSIANFKNEATGLRDLEIYLMNDHQKIMKRDIQTSLEGKLELQIPFATGKVSRNNSILIVDKSDKRKRASFPVTLHADEEIDLQFMPEGGYLVNGIYGKVGFKAISPNGLGKNIQGKIINNRNEIVAESLYTHKGMGSFYLTPKMGESYRFVYQLNGKEQQVNLPNALKEGTALRIEHLSNPDSLYVYIKASEGNSGFKDYHLLAQSADSIQMSSIFSLKNGSTTFKLPKNIFPDGIIHFTLFSPEGTPLNQRQVFLNRNKKIDLKVFTNKSIYGTKDSISLEILATNEDGSPLRGAFAISVTDDAYTSQKGGNGNIVSYFLLQSNIKGNIEDPAWYFQDINQHTAIALDHLLLTQAWVGYDWVKILQEIEKPKYKPEIGNMVEGTLKGLLKKPASNVNVSILALGDDFFATHTLTNSNGEFVFKDLPYLDSVAYTIKIKNTRGKSSGATIFVDEFIPTKDLITQENIKPWYVNIDSTSFNFYKNSEKKVTNSESLILEGNLLKEVEITGDSKERLFMQKVAWDARFFKKISEEDLKKSPNKTLYDLLKESIPEFNTTSGKLNFYIGSILISHVIIDKINTLLVASGMDDSYNETGVSRTETDPNIFETNKFIFNSLKASDVSEIVFYKGNASKRGYYFLNITTRSGKGPWISPINGVYVYRPLPVYKPREFYSPKYSVNTNVIQNLRPTIFWDANIVTDEHGKSKISFYSAGLSGSYTIKVEGTDLLGRFGYQKSTIKIDILNH